MSVELLVAGSNSGFQIHPSNDDLHSLTQATYVLPSSTRPDEYDEKTFPPTGHTVVDLASGANHTLALVDTQLNGDIESEGVQRTPGLSRQIFVSGTGSQGQLGPTHVLRPKSEPKAFMPIDFHAYLETVVGLPWTISHPPVLKKVACGWNCSYVVLTHSQSDTGTRAQNQEALISLGFHRDNSFGELGRRPTDVSSTNSQEGVEPCVHFVSFAGVLAEAGLDADSPFEILDLAAGLRHAVVGLLVRGDAESRVLIAGWGSARHGQVGRVPAAASPSSTAPRRPGRAPAVVFAPQLIFDWETPDPDSIQCKLRAGKEHAVVLVQGHVDSQTSILRCIGSDKQGQCAGADTSALLKYRVTPDQIVDVTCNWTSTHFLVSRPEGDAQTSPLILSCGSNEHGQFGNGTSESTTSDNPLTFSATNGHHSHLVKVKKLVSGSEHSLILAKCDSESSEVGAKDSESQVWGWGWNEHGNLAQGKESHEVHDQPVLLLSPEQKRQRRGVGHSPLDIWAGYGTTFILAKAETVDEDAEDRDR